MRPQISGGMVDALVSGHDDKMASISLRIGRHVALPEAGIDFVAQPTEWLFTCRALVVRLRRVAKPGSHLLVAKRLRSQWRAQIERPLASKGGNPDIRGEHSFAAGEVIAEIQDDRLSRCVLLAFLFCADEAQKGRDHAQP